MITKVSTPTDEQEFHVNYSPLMNGMCEIYTTIPHMIKYFEKLCDKFPEYYKVIKDDCYSLTVSAPFKLVKPRKPRILTDEQKRLSAERMNAIRNKQT